MDLRIRLTTLTKKIMEKIGDAASQSDIEKIRTLGAIATRIKEYELTLEEIERWLSDCEEEMDKKIEKASPNQPSTPSTTRIAPIVGLTISRPRQDRGTKLVELAEKSMPQSLHNAQSAHDGRVAGQDMRQRFLDSASRHGWPLGHLHGSVYQTDAGKTVVIPTAAEMRPDRWWLGVKDERFDFVSLLCQQSSMEMVTFVLPRSFLEPLWTSLSRSNGQLKFNVKREGRHFYLLVPGKNPQPLNKFMDGYELLGQ